MRPRSQKLAGFIILLLALAMILPVSAFEDTETRHIRPQDPGLDADWFVTEAGLGYHTSLVTITDPNMDIYAYLFFEDIKINYWQHLENATLWLRTASSMPFDAESKVTIYGVDDYRHFGSGTKGYGPLASPGSITGASLTTAHVNYNTSQFYGPQWWNISVTNIVQELKSNYNWDGPGFVRSDPGDNMGFIILSAGGYDTRYFYDLKAGNGLEAKLELHWGGSSHQPPEAPPPYDEGEWEYVNTTGGIAIWLLTDVGDMYFQVMGIDAGNDLWYQTSLNDPGDELEIPGSLDRYTSGAIDPIIGLGPWTFMIADNASTEVYFSNDGFQTWTQEEVNHQFPTLDSYLGNFGSLALDPDGVTIHVVWSSVTSGFPGDVYNVMYTNFTFNTVTENIEWATDYSNVTLVDTTQFEPVIYCQNNGTLHITWWGHQGTAKDQVFYRRRWANGTWMAQVRVTQGDSVDSAYSDIVANEDTGVALLVWAHDQGGADDIYWDVVFPNNTDGPDRQMDNDGYKVSMVNDRDNNVAQLVFEDGGAQPHIEFTTKVIDNTTAWGAKSNVSPPAQKHFTPDIGLDSDNRTIVVIWYNDWNLFTAYNTWQIGDAPAPQANRLTTEAILSNFIEDEFDLELISQTYWTAWPNGTLIDGPFDTFDDAVDDVELFLDDPENPDPGGEWGTTGPFTRFKMRLYFLILGFGCVFGPVLFFSWRRPTAYYLMVGAMIMIMGLGLLIAIGDI